MSRHPNDRSSAIDDSAWLSARIAPDQTAIFYHGTLGNDRILGSNFDDYFDLSQGGDDHAIGRGGDDVFYFGAAFTGADRVDGGYNSSAGDLVILDGDYSSGITVEESSLKNIERLGLAGGSFVIDGYLGFGGKFQGTIVDATSLTKHQSLDLAVSSRGNLSVTGGDGDDVIHGAINGLTSGLSGGSGDDMLIGEGGQTNFNGGAGADHIVMASDADHAIYSYKADSSPDHYDVIEGFKGTLVGAADTIYLRFDSDETKRHYQNDFHLGATPGHVGDIVVNYDAGLDHTIVNVFTNADDVPDFVLHLTGNVPLAIQDFVF